MFQSSISISSLVATRECRLRRRDFLLSGAAAIGAYSRLGAASANFPKRWSAQPPVGAQINWGHPLAYRLSVCWLFNEGGGVPHNLINETSGATANTTWGVGQRGKAVSFNGSSTYVRQTNHQLVDTNSVTMAFWGYCANWNASQMLIEKSNVNAAWEMYSYAGSSQIILVGGGTGTTVVSALPSAGWRFIVGTIQGTAGKIYIDGQQTGTGTVTAIADSNTSLYVGCYDNSGYFFTGIVEQACVWNRALSASEIQWLYINPYCFIQPQSPRLRMMSGFSSPPSTFAANPTIITVGP